MVGFLTAHVTVVYSFSIDNKMSGNMIVMYEIPAVYLEMIDRFVYMLCDVHEVRNKYYLHFRLVQISFCRLFKCKGYNMFVVVCPVPVSRSRVSCSRVRPREQ